MDITPLTPGAEAPFILTDAAAARINVLKTREDNASLRFRVMIKGGGCSGFQYEFDLDATNPADDDIIIAKEGAEVVVDETSMDMLKGSALDYSEDLASAGFKITNPNATASCGCGNSFSVSL